VTSENKTVRTSVTLAADDYEELQRIADRKKVSVSWVVRDAIEKYLTNLSPLFGEGNRGESSGQ